MNIFVSYKQACRTYIHIPNTDTSHVRVTYTRNSNLYIRWPDPTHQCPTYSHQSITTSPSYSYPTLTSDQRQGPGPLGSVSEYNNNQANLSCPVLSPSVLGRKIICFKPTLCQTPTQKKSSRSVQRFTSENSNPIIIIIPTPKNSPSYPIRVVPHLDKKPSHSRPSPFLLFVPIPRGRKEIQPHGFRFFDVSARIGRQLTYVLGTYVLVARPECVMGRIRVIPIRPLFC